MKLFVVLAVMFGIFFLVVIVAGKITFSLIKIGTRAVAKSNNPRIEVELEKARKMSNAELARAIRDESDIQVKEFLKEEFFARGNSKKDLYNY